MPIEPSKGPSKSAAAAFHGNASVLVVSNNNSQKRGWEKWWGQLDQKACIYHAPWLKNIDLDPEHPNNGWKCKGYDMSSKVFVEDLTEKLHSHAFLVPRNYGSHNLAIFTLSLETHEFESLAGDQIVVKLKAKGQTPTSVTSGVLKRTALPYNIGVIVMCKIPGQGLEDTDQWQEKIGERQGMLDKVFKNIQNFNYEFIEKTKLVHVMRNLPVDDHMNVYPIDFGPPSIYPVERVPSRSEFDAWFSERFDLIWDTQQGGKYRAKPKTS
ncbi:hypothetical protein F5876DRAFT_82621 [Lentinula aff. lateritia]|uniref:Uncharacterized protein n=1 Tax=Lentinula aff. lateritia TaxID=2804960 RepID=A0ACC1TJV8_9AGAR|nr:hypothetical protein F5876DRAFT_82621 [Lentinula aff. lateritia]